MCSQHTAKELYDAAFSHCLNKDFQKMLDASTILLVTYPDSREAKKALNLFPIKWDDKEKILTLKEIPSHLASILGFIIGVFVFSIYLSQISGDSGLAIIGWSPLIIGFFVVISNIIAGVFRKRGR